MARKMSRPPMTHITSIFQLSPRASTFSYRISKKTLPFFTGVKEKDLHRMTKKPYSKSLAI
jgi:hypothetical protein